MSRCCTPARFDKTLGAPAALVCESTDFRCTKLRKNRVRTRDRACDVPRALFVGNTVYGDRAASSDLDYILPAITTESWSGITNENRA
jgi:hypothetical protein